MPLFLEKITIFCFAASYGIALAIELWQMFRPRPILRVLATSMGAAGLFAHTAYLVFQQWTLGSPWGSLLFLAWILAVFYLYGAIHHSRLAWGLFVLPLILGLIVIAWLQPATTPTADSQGFLHDLFTLRSERFWGTAHGLLVLLAAVGISVGFVASLMYLVQVRRLKKKMAPGQGVKMMSLERIETMNRRAIVWAFPLLTAGLVVGVVMQLHEGRFLAYWTSPRILSGLGLWLVFSILLYLRYAAHVRGTQIAWWTVLAFAMLVMALVSPVHPFANGGMQ